MNKHTSLIAIFCSVSLFLSNSTFGQIQKIPQKRTIEINGEFYAAECGTDYYEQSQSLAQRPDPTSCSEAVRFSYGEAGAGTDLEGCEVNAASPNCSKFRIAIQFHLMGNDLNTTPDAMGRPVPTGAPAEIYEKIDDEMPFINCQFAAAGVEFFQRRPPSIPSTLGLSAAEADDFYNFERAVPDDDNTEINPYNLPDVINIWVVDNIDGNMWCGFAPIGGRSGSRILMDWNCMGRRNIPEDLCYTPTCPTTSGFMNNTTLAHELGHFFGLYHTFHQMGTGDYLTNDADLANGSTCATRGDKICDTNPDPRDYGPIDQSCTGGSVGFCSTAATSCVFDNPSNCVVDPIGMAYGIIDPPIGNIMSYNGRCRFEFSDCQLKKVFETAKNCANNFCTRDEVAEFAGGNGPNLEICLGDAIPTFQAADDCYRWYDALGMGANELAVGRSFTPTTAQVDVSIPGTYTFYLGDANELNTECRTPVTVTVTGNPGDALGNSLEVTNCSTAEVVQLSSNVGNLEKNKVVGWWITGSPLSISDQADLDNQIASATIGGPVAANPPNYLIASNGGTNFNQLDTDFDCSSLPEGVPIYATPVLSDNEVAAPTEFKTGLSGQANIDPFLNNLEVPICQMPITATLESVCVNIDYDCESFATPNDLSIFLIGPNGAQITLERFFAGTTNGPSPRIYDFCFVDDGTGYSDVGSVGCNANCLTGDLESENSFDRFDGLDPNGTWTVVFDDHFNDPFWPCNIEVELIFDQPAETLIFPTIEYSDCFLGQPIEVMCSCVPCSLDDVGLTNVKCNNNGTPFNLSDDFITFELNPTGASLGSDYTVSGMVVTPTIGNYGSATEFSTMVGTVGGGSLSLTLTDNDDSACTLLFSVDDPAGTQVGSMDQNTIEVCGADIGNASYDNSNEVLQAGDVVQFVLHDNAGAVIGNIISTNSTPDFSFGAGMNYGTTYYVSAVAGSNDGAGNIDLVNGCLQIAQGTPIMFFENPTATLSGSGTVCDMEATSLSIAFTGTGPWDLEYSDGSNTTSLRGLTDNPYTLTTTPGTTTTYSLQSVSNTNCVGTVNGTATITVNSRPSATVMTASSVCNSNQTGNNTLLNFSTLINAGDMSGTWTDVDGSGSVGGFPNLDFENIAPGDYTFRYTTNSAQPPCNEATYDVTITVEDCSCPSVLTMGAGPLCNDNAFLDLTDITLTTEAGIWSIVSAPTGSMASLSLNNFDATGSTAGSYELEYRLSMNVPVGCPESSTQTIEIFAPPSATVTNATSVCNSDQSGNLTTFDFSTLITSGDSGGSWVDVDGSGAVGGFPNLEFANIAPGDYTFIYTTNSAQAPCDEVSYDVMVTVEDCSCPSVLTTGVGPLCNDDAVVNLVDMTLTTEPGNWNIISQPNGATATILGGRFDATGSVAGDYELEFILDSPVAGCPESSTQTITVFAPPSATVTRAVSVCNSNQSGDPTTFDFSTLITAGDNSGSWVDVDGSGAVGGFPNLEFANITPGDYRFTYTTNSAQTPCNEVSYDVTVTVEDCSCPSVLTTGAGPFCNDNAMIDLADLTLTTEAGTWIIISEPNGSTAVIFGGRFDATGSAAGDYELEFRLNSPVAGCPESSAQTITIFVPPSATVTRAVSVCNSNQSGDPTTFDFSNLITAGDNGGSWVDVDGSGAVGGFPNLEFENITPGDYRFTYTTNSAQAPCNEVSYDVTLTVEDCSCPSVLTTGAGPFCNDNAVVNLADLTLTTEAGNWNIISEPASSTAAISSGRFDATGSTAGDYELEFRLDTPAAGCPESSTQTIEIIAAPEAGDLIENINFCDGNDETISLFDYIENFDAGGTWTDISANPVMSNFDAANATISSNRLAIGTYQFQYLVDGGVVCSPASIIVEAIVNESPTADAGLDVEINCDASAVTIGGNSSTGSDILYSWIGAVSDSNSDAPTTTVPGTYIMTVIDQATGCEATDEVVVSVSSDFPLMTTSQMDISCFGDEDGIIEVEGVSGGFEPYLFSLNGSAFENTLIFDQLEAGRYTLVVEDANGCRDTSGIDLLEPNEFSVALTSSGGNDIELGDKVLLTAVVTGSVETIEWLPDGIFAACDPVIDPDSCLTQEVQPDQAETYSVRVTNTEGCSDFSEITIRIIKSADGGVFVPDAFSPNDDGINDIFMPFTNQTVTKIKSFMVYDRWGEPVHKVFDVAPNDSSMGWDGKFNGDRINSGVYIWFAEVEYTDGTTSLMEGDVTVFK